jgi:hypothetical protein
MICDNSILKPLPSYFRRQAMADSPVAWWRPGLGGAAVVGSNDLTHVGGVTVDQPPLGMRGRSALYNGSTGYSHVDALPLASLDEFTIETLFRTGNSLPSSQVLFAFGDIAGDGGMALFLYDNGTLEFITPSDAPSTGPGVIHENTTYFVTIRVLEDEVSLFVNGEEVGTGSIDPMTLFTSSKTIFGALYYTDPGPMIDTFFGGWIDEIIVYPTGLSDQRILAHGRAAMTAAKSATDGVDLRIAGLTPATAKPMFSAMTHTGTPAYTRSVNCWLKGLDTSCVPVWNSRSGTRGCGVLVSPRHVLYASHQTDKMRAADTLRFVKMDNTIVNRTISSDAQVGETDIHVALLDSDVGSGIGFAPILPSNWRAHLPGNGDRIPVIGTDQERKALVFDTWETQNVNNGFLVRTPADATRLGFYEELIAGDSGEPWLYCFGHQLVAAATAHSPTSSDAFHANLAAINAVMTTLGGGYQLTEFDLSQWGAG